MPLFPHWKLKLHGLMHWLTPFTCRQTVLFSVQSAFDEQPPTPPPPGAVAVVVHPEVHCSLPGPLPLPLPAPFLASLPLPFFLASAAAPSPVMAAAAPSNPPSAWRREAKLVNLRASLSNSGPSMRILLERVGRWVRIAAFRDPGVRLAVPPPLWSVAPSAIAIDGGATDSSPHGHCSRRPPDVPLLPPGAPQPAPFLAWNPAATSELLVETGLGLPCVSICRSVEIG